ncbi:MAG: tetratricopeptide repeat protein [FCB group bacterium]|nr:tetratricopeptide repeat protein [FCB group bacterium]
MIARISLIILILGFICCSFAGDGGDEAPTTKELKHDLEHERKLSQAELKSQNEKIKRLEEKAEICNEAFEKEIERRAQEVENRMKMYVKFIVAILVAIGGIFTFIGSKTLKSWVNNISAEKIDQIIKEQMIAANIDKMIEDKYNNSVENSIKELDQRSDEIIENFKTKLEEDRKREIENNKIQYDLSIEELKPKLDSLESLRSSLEETKQDLERFPETLEKYKDAAEYSSRDWLLKGIAAYEVEKYQDSVEYFSKALLLDPSDSLTYGRRGNSFCYLGKFDEAILDYNKVLKNNPKDSLTLGNRGTTYMVKGALDQALLDFEEVIRIDPSDSSINLNMSELFIVTGDYEHAEKNLNTSLPLADSVSSVASNYYLSTILKILQSKEYNEELTIFNKALDSLSSSAKWNFTNIDNWLAMAKLEESKKNTIIEITERFKEKLSK